MKRTKLIASLMMCVFCLSFLVVGVWAAVTSVNFNLNGNLQFYSEGVYIELSGQVYRGDSTSTLEALSDPRFALEKQTNFDNSSGEPSGNFPMESWNIQNLTFTPVDRYIQVQVNIKNHSEFTITATPNVLLNSLDITSNTFTNFTVSENSNEIVSISSGETKTYKLTIQLNDNATEFSANTLSVSFDFEENMALDYIQWNSTDGYYYLEMGELSDGTPLEWRLVLERTGGDEDSTVDGVSGFTGNKSELAGKTYYFLLNTWTGGTSSADSPDACAFNNNYYYSSLWSHGAYGAYGSTSGVYAEEYAPSAIRNYITGTPILRDSVQSSNYIYDPTAHSGSGQESEEDFLTKYNIESSSVYNLIKGRTLADLYTKFTASSTPTDRSYNSKVESGTETMDPISSNTIDKLWILSYYEAYEITGSDGEDSSSARAWTGEYWLRTLYVPTYSGPNSRSCYYVASSGSMAQTPTPDNSYSTDQYATVDNAYCARPAFQMSF